MHEISVAGNTVQFDQNKYWTIWHMNDVVYGVWSWIHTGTNLSSLENTQSTTVGPYPTRKYRIRESTTNILLTAPLGSLSMLQISGTSDYYVPLMPWTPLWPWLLCRPLMPIKSLTSTFKTDADVRVQRNRGHMQNPHWAGLLQIFSLYKKLEEVRMDAQKSGSTISVPWWLRFEY